jgi:hypothetical protein
MDNGSQFKWQANSFLANLLFLNNNSQLSVYRHWKDSPEWVVTVKNISLISIKVESQNRIKNCLR